MNCKLIPLFLCIVFFNAKTRAQTKVLGECTIEFDIKQKNGNEWNPIGQKKVWVKGNQCKTVFTSASFVQTLIFNILNDSAIVTKEIGGSKFLQEIKYPPTNTPTLISMKKNETDSLVFIAGYPCNKILLEWSDGVNYEIQYTTEVITSVNSFELAFREVTGLVLAYTVSTPNGVKINYTAKNIDLSPIVLNQFEVNRQLYQIMEK